MKSIVVVYLMLLGVALGVEIAAGAFMAPVIFYPHKFIGDGVLSHFQSGVLMTQVFLKMNVVISVAALYAIAYEMQALIRHKSRDVISFALATMVLSGTMLFVFYYTPFIVNAQLLGAEGTTTEAFFSMHKQSEWIMKTLMVVQFGLLLRRGWLSQK